MWCLVKIPDGKTLAINCDAKAIGQECLEKVCQDLEILCEMDYFGLKTKDDDEWINLRNPLFGQRSGSDGTAILFVLGVKFWVPPELLLQNCVRHLFYMQARADLLAGKLLPGNWKKAAAISALLAHGDQVKFNPTALTVRCPCTATTLLTRKRNDTSNSECKKRKLSKDKYIEKLLITTNNSSQQQQQMKSTSTQQPQQQQQQQQQSAGELNKSRQLRISSSSSTSAAASASTSIMSSSTIPTTKSSSSTTTTTTTTPPPIPGNSNITTSPLNVYIDYILRPEGIINDDTLPENYLQTIAIEHSKLIQLEMSSESAKYWLLENISKLSGFGVEMFIGTIIANNTPQCRIGVGPHGLSIAMENVKRCVPFTDVCRSSSLKNLFKLTYIDHENKLIELEIRFVNPNNAKSIYRTLTEKHAFYSCETVRSVVQTQCQRNLKGTIVSMFKDTTTLGKRYVFDIQRTCREARDHAQRVLHSLGIEKKYVSGGTTTNTIPDGGDGESLTMPKLTANYAELLKQQKNVKIQMEKIVADRIIESFTCRICMDRQFNAMFSPCGHIIACNTCAEKCEICPVCRSTIEKVNKVFLPTDRITSPSEDISIRSTQSTETQPLLLMNAVDVELAAA